MYSNIEELALGTADVGAITGKMISDAIVFHAYPDMVLSQLFKENKELVGTNYRQIVIPKGNASSIIIHQNVSEGTTISASDYNYEGLTITPTKFGIRFEIPIEVLETPEKRNLLNDLLMESGRAWAKTLENRGRTVALNLNMGSITSWSGGSIGSTNLVPIIEIKEQIGCTVQACDYYNGSILLTGSVSTATVTFSYASNRLYSEVSNLGTLLVSDILNLRNEMTNNSMNPNFAIINPKDLVSALYDSKITFIDTVQYQKEKPIAGEVGKIFDIRILKSPYQPQGCVAVIDRGRLGYNIIKRPLEGVKKKEPSVDSLYFHIWAEQKFGVSDTLAVGILVNASTLASRIS